MERVLNNQEALQDDFEDLARRINGRLTRIERRLTRVEAALTKKMEAKAHLQSQTNDLTERVERLEQPQRHGWPDLSQHQVRSRHRAGKHAGGPYKLRPSMAFAAQC
ncbi:MAG: hypothetical protein JO122_21865 [Acetobacteraceae bacterium]|nr:hypothetical protein [Acetobacteraceae bacterium]